MKPYDQELDNESAGQSPATLEIQIQHATNRLDQAIEELRLLGIQVDVTFFLSQSDE